MFFSNMCPRTLLPNNHVSYSYISSLTTYVETTNINVDKCYEMNKNLEH